MPAAEFLAPQDHPAGASDGGGDHSHFRNSCVSELDSRTFEHTERSRIEWANEGPPLLSLSDPRAQDPQLTGAKAAALARAATQGLPALPGFVLTTAWSETEGFDPTDVIDAWDELSVAGERPLVVRSSSVAEDGAGQSMAGLFTSVLDVKGMDAFNDAVDEVLASRTSTGLVDAPMAVLVQPFLASQWGGVLFSADPVTGRTDRMVVTAVKGGADEVVGGEAAGWTATLGRHGRVREVRSTDGPAPSPSMRHRLAAMARNAEQVFGGPQDIEWAADASGRVVLLQSRPITTLHGPVAGPILGAGPVAETFPDQLSPLEQDLWLRPLADGLRGAIELTATAPAARIRNSPVATTVHDYPVVDLELLGATEPKRGLLRKLDPRPPARRLVAAWRVGRLTAALPGLIDDVIHQVDEDLSDVPRLDGLSNRSLLAILDNGRRALTTLHGYEAMAGMFAGDAPGTPTAASMGLSALAQARADGIDHDDLVEHQPVVLALLPPRIGPAPELPDLSIDPPAPNGAVNVLAIGREALRLRSRWMQELTGRAAWELGGRLASVGVLADRDDVRFLTLDELTAAAERRVIPADLAGRSTTPAAQLPAEFRLAADGTPMPVIRKGSGHATGAGGGVGRGRVHVGDDPPAGSVLVVTHLDPRLAPLVPRLAGLVAETGSPLSHLAILAREQGVPTVVGHRGAREQFRPGDLVEVDGTTGEVSSLVDLVDRPERGRPAAGPADSDGADDEAGDTAASVLTRMGA